MGCFDICRIYCSIASNKLFENERENNEAFKASICSK